MNETAPTYLLVDGENIDATLGLNLLGRRPNPEERPRWDRVREFAEGLGKRTKALFFLNASAGQLPMNFVQALMALGFVPIPLAGNSQEKAVDIGIQRMLEAIEQSGAGSVILASHDGDFIPQVETLLERGHEVGVLGFRECLNIQLAELQSRGLKLFDLEFDVGAFQVPLPRIRIIPLAEFDPTSYL